MLQLQLIFWVRVALHKVLTDLTLNVLLPVDKPVNTLLDCQAPPFALYSKVPLLIVAVTVTRFKVAPVQLGLTALITGKGLIVAITAVLDPVVQPFAVAST